MTCGTGWIDVSRAVGPATPVWPGDAPWALSWTSSIPAGAVANVGAISGSTHAGTHVDAPLHAIDGGTTAAELPLEAFLGPAVVFDVAAPGRGDDPIDPDELGPLEGVARILLRTGCDWTAGFPRAFRGLSPDAARRLADEGVRLVGTDAPSIDPYGSTALEAHRILLSRTIPVVEGLDLAEIEAGRYEFVALPMRWEGADATPVRAAIRRADAREP